MTYSYYDLLDDGEEPDPTLMQEVVDTVLKEIPEKDLRELASRDEDDLLDYHFGLGMSIRNRFGLWENEDLLRSCGTHCADTASGRIIRETWKRARRRCL